MEPEFEELDDIVEAHTAVVFFLEQDAAVEAATNILTFLEIETHLIDLTGKPRAQDMVVSSSRGFQLPVIFLNGNIFSDAFTLMTVASNGELAGYLDRLGIAYDAESAAALAAANQ